MRFPVFNRPSRWRVQGVEPKRPLRRGWPFGRFRSPALHPVIGTIGSEGYDGNNCFAAAVMAAPCCPVGRSAGADGPPLVDTSPSVRVGRGAVITPLFRRRNKLYRYVPKSSLSFCGVPTAGQHFEIIGARASQRRRQQHFGLCSGTHRFCT